METDHNHLPVGEVLGRMPPALWAVTWKDTPIGSSRARRYVLTFHRKADAERLAERCKKMKMDVEIRTSGLEWNDAE